MDTLHQSGTKRSRKGPLHSPAVFSPRESVSLRRALGISLRNRARAHGIFRQGALHNFLDLSFPISFFINGPRSLTVQRRAHKFPAIDHLARWHRRRRQARLQRVQRLAADHLRLERAARLYLSSSELALLIRNRDGRLRSRRRMAHHGRLRLRRRIRSDRQLHAKLEARPAAPQAPARHRPLETTPVTTLGIRHGMPRVLQEGLEA
jgi:hypothetical protein